VKDGASSRLATPAMAVPSWVRAEWAARHRSRADGEDWAARQSESDSRCVTAMPSMSAAVRALDVSVRKRIGPIIEDPSPPLWGTRRESESVPAMARRWEELADQHRTLRRCRCDDVSHLPGSRGTGQVVLESMHEPEGTPGPGTQTRRAIRL
jgi:hypothetical protein